MCYSDLTKKNEEKKKKRKKEQKAYCTQTTCLIDSMTASRYLEKIIVGISSCSHIETCTMAVAAIWLKMQKKKSLTFNYYYYYLYTSWFAHVKRSFLDTTSKK